MKILSKKLGVTINDIVTCAITTALRKLFDKNGDTNKDIQLVIPANIRFEFYPSRDKVKLENKFSAIPLRVPLTDSMKSAYKPV